jgi:hypothetical protein
MSLGIINPAFQVTNGPGTSERVRSSSLSVRPSPSQSHSHIS